MKVHATTDRPDAARLLAVVSIVFLADGMSQGVIGPVLQELAQRTGATAIAASGMLTAAFLAGLLSQTVVALVLKRAGPMPIMLFGMACFLAGAFGIALANSLPVLWISAACKGLGDGALLLLGNVLAAEASKGAGPLNLVNALFGVGAIASPALVSLAMIVLGSGLPGLWAAPCVMAVALVLLMFWRPAGPGHSRHAETLVEAAVPTRRLGFMRTPLVWLVAGFVLLEACIETSIGTWLPTLLNQAAHLPLTAGSMALSLFWSLMTASRFVAAWASRWLVPFRLMAIVAGMNVVACLLFLLAALTESTVLALAAVSLLGSALGPVLPSALSFLRLAYPRHAGGAAGLAFGCCNIGAALVPPLLGLLMARGGVAAGSGALLIAALGMATLLAAIGANRLASRGGAERARVAAGSLSE